MKRKRILYRSWHRGMRELDLILGPFAEHFALIATDQELSDYELFLDLPDQDILKGIYSKGNSGPCFEALQAFLWAKQTP